MAASHPHALSSKQERRLRDYLDDKLLDISRNYRKRSEPSSSVPTLPAYLSATQPLLSMILQIPPVPPSASLRTAFLLRLTNDVLTSILGYLPRVQDLECLLDWLDDLDNAWVVVVKGQVWAPRVQRANGSDTRTTNATNGTSTPPLDSEGDVSMEDVTAFTPRTVSQTDRTRLRSLVLSFSSHLEDWVSRLEPTPSVLTDALQGDQQCRMEELDSDQSEPSEESKEMESIFSPEASASNDIQTVLRRLQLQDSFDNLFTGTMGVLGDLKGVVLTTGEEVVVHAC